MTASTPRPWYVIDALADDYRVIAANGGDFSMLKTVKIARSIIVNLGIIGVAAYSLLEGAEPTAVGIATIATLGLYNGVEAADYVAFLEAFSEARDARDDDT